MIDGCLGRKALSKDGQAELIKGEKEGNIFSLEQPPTFSSGSEIYQNFTAFIPLME